MNRSDERSNDEFPMGERWRQGLEALFRLREPALPAFLALYHEHIEFQDPLQRVSGLTAFAELNRRFVGRARHLAISIQEMAEQHDVLFAAWRMRFTPRLGPGLVLEGVSHLRVRQERIIYQRDHFDTAGGLASALPGLSALYRAVLTRLT